MRIELKSRVKEQWETVDLKTLEGQSIAKFIAEASVPTIAALFDQEKAVAFISNDDSTVAIYREKGLSMHAEDFIALVGTAVAPELVIRMFPEAKLNSIEVV